MVTNDRLVMYYVLFYSKGAQLKSQAGPKVLAFPRAKTDMVLPIQSVFFQANQLNE